MLVFTNFFEALSAFLGISEAGNLKDANGEPRRIKQSMHVDALSSLASAPLGTSPAIVYIESIAGISQGGRTGLVALVAALLFLPFLFLSPLLSLVPAIATAPVLIMHGVRDRVVPFRLGERLYAMANEPKAFVRFPDGDHEDLDRYDHLAAARQFLAQHLR